MCRLQECFSFSFQMIDKLEKLVKNLNREREQYHRQIGDLQSEYYAACVSDQKV